MAAGPREIITGFDDFIDELDEIIDTLEEAEERMEIAQKETLDRVADEFIEEANDNVDRMPYNLSELKRAWTTRREMSNRLKVINQNNLALIFDKGTMPAYTIEPDEAEALAIPVEEWEDVPMAVLEQQAEERHDVDSVDEIETIFLKEFEHPGIPPQRWFRDAINEAIRHSDRPQEIAEEEMLKQVAEASK